jgi:hypothetical protein
VLVDGHQEPGWHSAFWDGRGRGGVAPAGVYLVKLEGAGAMRVEKVVLAR